MRKLLLIGVVAISLALVGCNAKPSLVGKWKGQIESQGQVMDADIDVSADKMVSVFTVQGMTITGTSSYKIEGDKIITTVEDVKMSGANVPPQVQSMLDAAVAKEKGKKSTSTLKFKDNDTVELSAPQGGNMTWTRVK